MIWLPQFVRNWVARHGRLAQVWDWVGPAHDKDTVGKTGEQFAADYLWTQGCKILCRNYKQGKAGELDVVVRHGDVLAFVEVKTRSTEDFGRPALAVDQAKREHIAEGVMLWLSQLDIEPNWRCDIVEVILERGKVPVLRWLQSAFTVHDTRKRAARRARQGTPRY
jgi:putative endonuclease